MEVVLRVAGRGPWGPTPIVSELGMQQFDPQLGWFKHTGECIKPVRTTILEDGSRMVGHCHGGAEIIIGGLVYQRRWSIGR